MLNKSDKQCRICRNESPQHEHLFTNTFPNSSVSLVDFLRQITSLEIWEHDCVPNILCLECLAKLTDCFVFSQLCISAEQSFKNLTSNAEAYEQTVHNDLEVVEGKPEVYTCKIIDEKRYKCGFCDLTFNARTDLAEHRDKHKPKLYQCEECSKEFGHEKHLKVHLRSHLKDADKQYSCKICHVQFAYLHLLKQHEYKHADIKPFPCQYCDKGCLTAESLKRHMKTHDKDYIKKKHHCSICSKEFPYPSFLAEHMKNHTGEKPYLCTVCGKSFRQSGGLHYHQRVHTGYRPFPCPTCNESFMSRSVLKVHMRKHTNERPYICHVCGVAFRRATDLKSHQRTHTGEKPVLCTICGKRFSTTGQLTVHIRSHTGEKPFACSWCSKCFSTKTMLVKHERIHTGERPYVCDICNRAFNQSGSLRSHKVTHLARKGPKQAKRRRNKQEHSAELCANGVIDLHAINNEFMESGVADIEVLRNEEGGKTQYTVILPAPTPLMQNL